jgi:murein DD-endopeptidase MepM/ murein hydrolase activator NlpD
MDKKKTTVIIMSYDGTAPKTFKIKTTFIRNFKKYFKVLAGVSFLFVFAIAVFIITYYLTKIQNEKLFNEITRIKKEVALLDSAKLTEKINYIESNITKLNNYLIERGVYRNIPSEQEKIVFDKVDKYVEQSLLFMNTFENIPLGFPYHGNVSSEYGYRKNPFGGYNGEFHPGIDFKGEWGDPVFATGKGVVERCDWYFGYGNAVVLRHDEGLTVIYGHLSKVNVIQNQQVNAGDLIGYIGSTGRSTGPHLHYEIRRNNEDIDPNSFIHFD